MVKRNRPAASKGRGGKGPRGKGPGGKGRELESARRKSFVATCRRLAAGGWLGPSFAPIDAPDDASDKRFRETVKRVFGAGGARPGDESSWGRLAGIALRWDAPESELLHLARRWMSDHPLDPTPYELVSEHYWIEGNRPAAHAWIDRGLESPAGPRLREVLRRVHAGQATPSSAGPGSGPAPRPRPARARPTRSRPETAPSRPGASPARQRRVEPVDPVGSGRILRKIREAAARLPELAPVEFADDADRSLTLLGERLLSREDDGLERVELAEEAAGLIAADRFDRLLSLDLLRGVDRLDYQIDTVRRVLKRFRGRVLLADEVGLGKTIEACLVLSEYRARGHVQRALVLVPAALVGQWRAELTEKFGIEARTTQDAGFRRDPETFWSGAGVIVASIATARSAAHRDRLVRARYDLVIVDEAHHLKNRRTRSWELVNRIRSRFFLMLTATPVETDLKELYNLVTLLRPGTLGTEAEFRRRFVDSRDPTRPSDPDRLRELLREVMVRNTRALCGVPLPPRTARTILVDPSPGERELYARIVEASRRLGRERRSLLHMLLEQAGSSPRAVAVTARRALERGERADGDQGRSILASELAAIHDSARDLTATAKLDRLGEILDGERTLVFSRFRSTMDEIGTWLEDQGRRWRAFHGSMSGPEKDAAVTAFAEAGCEVLVCSEIGGEGRNLQFCHRLVNFDLPWNPMSIEQRIGRIHRIGQTEAVEVINLAAAGSAEDRILDVLDRRIRMFELVVGEMDLLLGDLEDERDFRDRVFDIYRESRTDEEIRSGFDRLADRLQQGRRRLEATKALDETLFGEDYEA